MSIRSFVPYFEINEEVWAVLERYIYPSDKEMKLTFEVIGPQRIKYITIGVGITGTIILYDIDAAENIDSSRIFHTKLEAEIHCQYMIERYTRGDIY